MKNSLSIKMNLLTIILVSLLFTVLVSNGVFAATGFILSAGTVRGETAEQVNVDITAANAQGTEGGQFVLTYDPALVEPVAISAGDLVIVDPGNLFMANLDYSPGQLMVMWVTASGNPLDQGVVCTLTFNPLNDGASALEFSNVVLAPEGLTVSSAKAGQITVGDPNAAGSTNGDNSQAEEDQIAPGEGDDIQENQNADASNEEGNLDSSTEDDQDAGETGSELRGISPLVTVLIVFALLVITGLFVFRKKFNKSA